MSRGSVQWARQRSYGTLQRKMCRKKREGVGWSNSSPIRSWGERTIKYKNSSRRYRGRLGGRCVCRPWTERGKKSEYSMQKKDMAVCRVLRGSKPRATEREPWKRKKKVGEKREGAIF